MKTRIATHFAVALAMISLVLASGERLRRGGTARTLSTNDEAHNITKTVQICKKKTDSDCGIWNSMFHEDDFECKDYTFTAAYDACKGLDRHRYCGCDKDSELLEWVNKFLEERRAKNWVRYGGRPYPRPQQEGSQFLQFALCLKDEDGNGLLCRECEFWKLKHMAKVCNTSTATEEYCGCSENAILEYYDALEKNNIRTELEAQQGELRAKASKETAANGDSN